MLISNGRVALPGSDELVRCDVRIIEERIAEIGMCLPADGPELDAAGLLILPGAIDAHVHLNDPGYTEREDFFHGTSAAAAGGVTTVVDMPCTSIPPVTSLPNLRQKVRAIEGKAVVDYGLYGGVSAQSLAGDGLGALEELASHVFGFKAYFVSGMESFGRLDHHAFEQTLRKAAALERPVLLHAEDYDYVQAATPTWQAVGSRPEHYYRSRPEIAELLAVQNAIAIAEETGADLHIVHVGTAAAAELLGRGAATGETAPHYLAFDLDDFRRIGSALKVTPPVKSTGNRERLWTLLAQGVLDYVASDHAPCPAAGKATGSVWSDYAGLPGTGTMLPYLYSEGYVAGRLSLSRLVEVTSASAARRLGLDRRKGAIRVGQDADLVLIDPAQAWTVRGSEFASKGKVTPFEGATFQGRVVKTLVRGRVVYDVSLGVTVDPGYGRFLAPDR